MAAGPTPKPPSSPYPSCNPAVTPTITVTKRDAAQTPVAGVLSFVTVVNCGNDQTSMSLTTTLTTKAGKKLATATASCSLSPSADCNALKIAASKKLTKRLAGDYLLVTKISTTGVDWQVAHAQSTAGLWTDPCTHDATWTTNACTDTSFLQVK
jgi:hypothetical protein